MHLPPYPLLQQRRTLRLYVVWREPLQGLQGEPTTRACQVATKALGGSRVPPTRASRVYTVLEAAAVTARAWAIKRSPWRSRLLTPLWTSCDSRPVRKCKAGHRVGRPPATNHPVLAVCGHGDGLRKRAVTDQRVSIAACDWRRSARQAKKNIRSQGRPSSAGDRGSP
jgi:hypothetical protein